MRARSKLFFFAAAALSTGCFASKADFEKLQADMLTARVTSSVADSIQRAELIEVTRSVRSLGDSISALNRRLASMKTASDADIAAIKEDVAQLQDLSGQSEQRLRDMRAALEEKAPAPPDASAATDSTAAAGSSGGPGPGPSAAGRPGQKRPRPAP